VAFEPALDGQIVIIGFADVSRCAVIPYINGCSPGALTPAAQPELTNPPQSSPAASNNFPALVRFCALSRHMTVDTETPHMRYAHQSWDLPNSAVTPEAYYLRPSVFGAIATPR
jgi:hypothetical protein